MTANVEPEIILHLAGESVAAGVYRRLDAETTILLEQADFLPASLDGQVACYIRIDLVQPRFSSGEAVVKVKKTLQEESNVQEDTRLR